MLNKVNYTHGHFHWNGKLTAILAMKPTAHLSSERRSVSAKRHRWA
jgi:hypothetical protein